MRLPVACISIQVLKDDEDVIPLHFSLSPTNESGDCPELVPLAAMEDLASLACPEDPGIEHSIPN